MQNHRRDEQLWSEVIFYLITLGLSVGFIVLMLIRWA